MLAVEDDEDTLQESTSDMFQLIDTLRSHEPFPVGMFCLGEDDPLVKYALERKAELSRGSQSKDDEASWRRTMDDWLKKCGLTWKDAQPTPELLASPWFCILPNRERLTLAALLKAFPDKISFDISQQVARAFDVTDSTEDAIGTISPGGQIYLVELMRFMIGAEELHMQGIPMKWIRNAFSSKMLNETSAKQFAGNSYTLSVCVAFYIGLFIYWPFPKMANIQMPAPKSLERFL